MDIMNKALFKESVTNQESVYDHALSDIQLFMDYYDELEFKYKQYSIIPN